MATIGLPEAVHRFLQPHHAIADTGHGKEQEEFGQGNARPQGGWRRQSQEGPGGEARDEEEGRRQEASQGVAQGLTQIVAQVIAQAVPRPGRDPQGRGAEIDKERGVILEEIKRGEDNPSKVLWDTLISSSFPTHPYGRLTLGPRENISKNISICFDFNLIFSGYGYMTNIKKCWLYWNSSINTAFI